MTTSISNASARPSPADADIALEHVGGAAPPAPPPSAAPPATTPAPPRTLWSRFILLTICLAVILSTIAFGTVHAWSLAVFQAGAGAVLVLWAIDAGRTGYLRVSKNFLQLPLLAVIALGLVQLLPLGAEAGAIEGLTRSAGSYSYDPYATRFVIVQFAALTVYFAAALAFVDTPARLRLVVRTLVIFGFVLALFGLMQWFTSPQAIFWVRENKYAQPFGPYVNRHHFAAMMEMLLALPLGLLFAGAVERDRIPLYGFASLVLSFALVMTNSRGGVLSLVAEILFLMTVALGSARVRGDAEADRRTRATAAIKRAALGFGIIAVIFTSVLFFGGEESLSRLVGTVNAQDPTTGRTHFWSRTVEIIEDHPVLGTGLGSFPVVYPRYDTRGGQERLEQAHNDYLQTLSDAGIVGGVIGLLFIVALFRVGFRRAASRDKFRRGVALGALAGCFGVLVHSFFDFTLHTTANALAFLMLAAVATVNGRVEDESVKRQTHGRRRRRRRTRQHHHQPHHRVSSGGGDAPERALGRGGAAGETPGGAAETPNGE
ncbi:MAG TPA: O-antigen ligase family protein [Pyrinomonadaceae bacterium]|nr:O-antigen ligase family protein [Pyrinomonadaceae bacterium]